MSIVNRRNGPSDRRTPGSDATYCGPFRRSNVIKPDRRQQPYVHYDPPQADAAKWGTEFAVTKEEHTRQIIDPPPPAPRVSDADFAEVQPRDDVQLRKLANDVLRTLKSGSTSDLYGWVPRVLAETVVMLLDRTGIAAPIPLRIVCPECFVLHVDEGEFATKPHHTHACQNCGNVWRPAVVNTVGVRFLPGYKDEQ